jgi:hypothetical protein
VLNRVQLRCTSDKPSAALAVCGLRGSVPAAVCCLRPGIDVWTLACTTFTALLSGLTDVSV